MKTETRRDGAVQLADWWEDLLWPRVLCAAALGIRPGRIGLAFFGLVVGLVLVTVGLKLDTWVHATGAVPQWASVAGPEGPFSTVWNVVVATPASYLVGQPCTTIIFVFFILPIELMIIGAISRLTALEFCRGEFGSWTEAMSFSIGRLKSLVGAVVGPLLVVWGIALLLAAGGWLLLNWPYVNAVGAALYILALILGIAGSLIAIVYLVGNGLLVPAVVCDGADAIDAIQRAYAYTLDRPMRLIVYFVLAAIGFAFTIAVIGLILGTGIWIACAATRTWVGPEADDMILQGTLAAIPVWHRGGELPVGTYGTAAWIIRLWTMLPVYGLLACVLSCCIACKTVVYLAIRRICDGQDTAELWVPGMIEGVMGEALRGRAEASGVSATGAGASAQADEE